MGSTQPAHQRQPAAALRSPWDSLSILRRCCCTRYVFFPHGTTIKIIFRLEELTASFPQRTNSRSHHQDHVSLFLHMQWIISLLRGEPIKTQTFGLTPLQFQQISFFQIRKVFLGKPGPASHTWVRIQWLKNRACANMLQVQTWADVAEQQLHLLGLLEICKLFKKFCRTAKHSKG